MVIGAPTGSIHSGELLPSVLPYVAGSAVSPCAPQTHGYERHKQDYKIDRIVYKCFAHTTMSWLLSRSCSLTACSAIVFPVYVINCLVVK